MLIPREKPYLERLNSYYLDFDKFVMHLQGDIGSGCVYCKSSYHEVLIYFDESEIIRGVVQENGKHAKVSPTLQPVLDILHKTSYAVSVYSFDPNAIYFWGQMPSFRRAKKTLNSKNISLVDLVERLSEKKFTGFIDVDLEGDESTLLFFHHGERVGGSYSWSFGGLNRASSEFDVLMNKIKNGNAKYIIGNFLDEEIEVLKEDPNKKVSNTLNRDSDGTGEGETSRSTKEIKSEIGAESIPDTIVPALMDFINLFEETLKKKAKLDPIILLKQQFVDNVQKYPYLDPFRGQFDYMAGKVTFGEGAPYREIIAAVVECVWTLIYEHNLEKKFYKAVEKLTSKVVFEEQGISIIMGSDTDVEHKWWHSKG
ncbi:MAG: hypothetical protein OEM02_13800 [Desulfobulbaceae bacterium]|nr:hypothetical protein [Desulfobulbaceae bacterium]